MVMVFRVLRYLVNLNHYVLTEGIFNSIVIKRFSVNCPKMKKHFILFCFVFFALNGKAEIKPFWYASYNYDGPFIVSHDLSYFQVQLRKTSGKEKVFAYVDLGNKYYLNKDFDNTLKTFEEAVNFAESNADTSISNLKYGL